MKQEHRCVWKYLMQFAFAVKHKLTLHFEQITRVFLLDPCNLDRPCFRSHMYEGQCANKSKRIHNLGSEQLDHIFSADKSFSNREVDGPPGVLSLPLAFIFH